MQSAFPMQESHQYQHQERRLENIDADIGKRKPVEGGVQFLRDQQDILRDQGFHREEDRERQFGAGDQQNQPAESAEQRDRRVGGIGDAENRQGGHDKNEDKKDGF